MTTIENKSADNPVLIAWDKWDAYRGNLIDIYRRGVRTWVSHLAPLLTVPIETLRSVPTVMARAIQDLAPAASTDEDEMRYRAPSAPKRPERRTDPSTASH
jgi:hypothetical protein